MSTADPFVVGFPPLDFDRVLSQLVLSRATQDVRTAQIQTGPHSLPRDAAVVPGAARPSAAPPHLLGEQNFPEACAAVHRWPSPPTLPFRGWRRREIDFERHGTRPPPSLARKLEFYDYRVAGRAGRHDAGLQSVQPPREASVNRLQTSAAGMPGRSGRIACMVGSQAICRLWSEWPVTRPETKFVALVSTPQDRSKPCNSPCNEPRVVRADASPIRF
jgi:hypothetical protein